MDDKITIDESWIQAEAGAAIDRELSRDEYLEVIRLMSQDMFMIIQDKINQVVEHNALLERNKDAEKVFPHFVVFYRNENAFQDEFEHLGVFKNESDAQAFIRHDGFLSKFDEWRVVQIDESGTGKEVYKVNC